MPRRAKRSDAAQPARASGFEVAASSPIFRFCPALADAAVMRANAIDTGFIERELAGLATGGRPPPISSRRGGRRHPSPRKRRAKPRAQPRRIRRGEAPAWMPVGRRQRAVRVPPQAGAEHKGHPDAWQRSATLSSVGATSCVLVRASCASKIGASISILGDCAHDHVRRCDRRPRPLRRTRNGRLDLHGSIRSAATTMSRSARTRSWRRCRVPSWRCWPKSAKPLEKGAPILTLEVMKMEQTLRAPFARRAEGDQMQGRRYRRRRRRTRRGRARRRRISMSDSVRIVEVGPRDGLQNEKTPRQRRRPHRLHRGADRRGAAHRRGRGLRLAEGDPADGGFGPGAARRQPSRRQRIPRAGAERKGLTRPRARPAPGDRGVCLGVRRLFAGQHQLLGRRIHRAVQAGGRAGQGRRRQGARLYFLRARLPL